jgi:transcription elongation factor GreA
VINTEFYSTPNGIRKLEDQLRILKERQKIAKVALGEANLEDPDLPENTLSKQLREELGSQLPTQIAAINTILEQTVIITPESPLLISHPADVVWIGSLVTIQTLDSDTTEQWQVAGYNESDPDENVIAYNTALGSELLGKKSGDIVRVNEGRWSFVVLSVIRVLENTSDHALDNDQASDE